MTHSEGDCESTTVFRAKRGRLRWTYFSIIGSVMKQQGGEIRMKDSQEIHDFLHSNRYNNK